MPGLFVPSATRNGSAISIAARDGFTLTGSLFGPERAKRRVIIASATGVSRAYYRRFAQYLADRGWPTLTFDYRGIGGSRPESLRGFEASMLDWAQKDLAGVVDHAQRALGAERIAVIGHSFGGQAVGLLPNADALRAVVGIAAQSGDLRLWPAPDRYAFAAVMGGIIPLTTTAVGYLPGKLGIGEDLPAGVARQWARWCRQPGYFVGGKRAPRLATFRRLIAPTRLYSFSDDRYAPSAAVDALGSLLVSAHVERRHVDVRELGRPVGHFGFFRPHFEASLWGDVAHYLDDADEGRITTGRELAPTEQEALDAYMFDRYHRPRVS